MINKPYGLRPSQAYNGSEWNGSFHIYYVPQTDATELSPGDLVMAVAGGDANGIPAITKWAGAGNYRGILLGFMPSGQLQPTALAAAPINYAVQNAPASKTQAYYAMVMDDPTIMCEIQDDGLAALTAADIGLNAAVTITNPVAPGQISQTVLTTSSPATTAALPLKIMGLVQSPGNTFGAYANWLVKLNMSDLSGNSVGA